MSLSDIADRKFVLNAIEEFDSLGRDAFLAKYEFGASRAYWLVHNGKRYDSKAIIGAAHGFAFPALGPLKAHEFVGGEQTVRRKLEALGFTVTIDSSVETAGTRTSEKLTRETIYTRKDLIDQFGITDATINTGIFQPKDTQSVWLFVTEEKTADRTQYHDRIEGDFLYWQGQLAGLKDALIVDHKARGLELLVFYRKRKYEHPGAGFRYLGLFNYVEHSGSRPANFILRQQSPAPLIDAQAADQDEFDPENLEDARRRVLRSVAIRRGQRAFRDSLFAAYDGTCAITGCAIPDLLEAAHIYPYRGAETNRTDNGLLLRADIHTLFDCGLLAIDSQTMTVLLAEILRSSEYADFHGAPLRPSASPDCAPSKKALDLHRKDAKI